MASGIGFAYIEPLRQMEYQRTIKKSIEFSGRGLHTGKKVRVILKPAQADHGIIFERSDLSPSVRIPGLNSYVVDTRFSTTLGREGVTVGTVEHLMSALWGCDIDNVLAQVDGPEIPIMDGSSLHFAKQLRKVGLRKLYQPRRYFVITKPISIVEGDKYCYLLPHSCEKLSCSIEFDHKLVQKQRMDIKLTPDNYYNKICRARTFGFVKDVERLRKMGLIKGGSLENAVMLDHKEVLNPSGLKYEDEFVRHKILDTIGDIALMGVRVLGHFVLHKAGHELHYRLIRKALLEECGYMVGAQEGIQEDFFESRQPLIQSVSA